jgi:sigma-E factor negative regulatory protein RseC
MKNSDNYGSIIHEGIVSKTLDKSVIISIFTATACAGCHAENSCMLSGREEKSVEVIGTYNVKPGDPVKVMMKQSQGYRAILLGYVFPLVTVILCLIILNESGVKELTAGIISIGILAPYYLILSLFRKQINKNFTFKLII